MSTIGFVGGMSYLLHEMHIQSKVVISTSGFVGGMSDSVHEIDHLDIVIPTIGFDGRTSYTLCKMTTTCVKCEDFDVWIRNVDFFEFLASERAPGSQTRKTIDFGLFGCKEMAF